MSKPSGTITSFNGFELGVHLTYPPAQEVVTNPEVAGWKVQNVDGKNHHYRLGLSGYPFSAPSEELRVIASTDSTQSQEWHIVYRKTHKAYTIEIPGTNMAWTVSDEDQTT